MATKTSLEITKGGSPPEPVQTYVSGPESEADETDLLRPFPTEEEWATLPRVAGSIPWTAWTVAFVEFVERFSYYGTSAVCKYSLLPSLSLSPLPERSVRPALSLTVPPPPSPSRELHPETSASGINHRRWLP